MTQPALNRKRPMTTKSRPPRRTRVATPKPPVEESPRLIRSFAADIAAAQAEYEPPVVELTEGQLFRFAARIPAGWWGWFMEETSKPSWTLVEAVEVLMRLVAPEDRERLEAALADTVVVIGAPIVHDIRTQLLAFYVARPTMPSPSSPSVPSTGGAASGPGAPSGDSTPSTSNPGS